MGCDLMAVYTFEVATEYNFPNITVYRKLTDGVQTAWRINANEGYVFYDTTANNTDFDPETMEEIPVIYYYTVASLSMRTDMENFHWVAVPRDSVDENYIFGVGDNKHEAM
jgi:hypothetical protein